MRFPEENLKTTIAVLNTEMKSITEKLDTHTIDQKEDFKVFHKLIKSLSDKIGSLSDQLDKKYAGKWVEYISSGALISIIGGIIVFAITKT